MDKGVGKHQKVRLLPVKTEIQVKKAWERIVGVEPDCEKSYRYFLLRRECSPRTVPDVENDHNMAAFVYRVNDSVGAWFLPKKKMAKFLAFPNDCPALGKSLQTINPHFLFEL
jgi:hypothetical protein